MVTSKRRPAVALTLMAAAAISCDDGKNDTEYSARTVDVSRADIRAAVHSNGELARKLLGALSARPGNLAYSPLSLEAVLGMLYGGARAETAQQLAQLLGVENAADLHEGLGALLEDLSGDHGYRLDLAQQLFVEQTLSPLPEFTALMNDAYRAPQQALDFAHAPEDARGTINDWIAQHTQDAIPELLQAGDVHSQTVLSVVNALYFQADWAKAFDPANTFDGTFLRADGSHTPARMMSLAASKLRTAQLVGGTVLELPYRDGELSFLALLPETIDGLAALERTLAERPLADVVATLTETNVGVTLPKFELATDTRADLIPTLQALGVTDLFDSARADLTGIAGEGGLWVEPLLQEAHVKVDEHGTVAAVATVAGLPKRLGAPAIQLDHPFAFMVYDRRTGAVIVAGHVTDPGLSTP